MNGLKIGGRALILTTSLLVALPSVAPAQILPAKAATASAPAAAPQDDTTVTILAKRRYSAESAQEQLADGDLAFACAFALKDEGKGTGRKHSPHTGNTPGLGGGPAGTGASAYVINGAADDGSIAGQVASGACEANLDDPTYYRVAHSRILQDAYAAYDAKDYARALPLFEQAYNSLSVQTNNSAGSVTLRGLTPVAVLVGRMYARGQGTKPDTAKAVEWLKKAAQAQYSPPGLRDPHYNDVKYMSPQAEAAVTLARIYQYGVGVPASPVEARRWYLKAADLDYFPAVHVCGLMFQSGYGGERNLSKAVSYFTRAGTAGPDGFAPSQYALGELYYTGADGVPQNKTRAGAWLLKAAKNQYPDALYAVARMYELGEGGAQVDVAKALIYYKEAAVAGQVDAQVTLATCLYSGENGAPKDLDTARKLFTQASEQGNPDAMFNLGVMMANGEGGAKDLVHAYAWFYIADKGGVPTAHAAMTELAGRMTPDERAQAEALLNPKSKS